MKTPTEWMQDAPPRWTLQQDAWDPAAEGRYETLLTLTNGYLGCRGNLELPSAGRNPGLYIAGVYDKPDRPDQGEAFGLTLQNKAITPAYAIAPLWNLAELRIDGQEIDFLNATVQAFRRTLDMRRGLLASRYELTDPAGRTTRVEFLSAALLTDRHRFVCRCAIEALNYTSELTVRFLCRQPTDPQYIPRLKDYISHTEYLGARTAESAVCIQGRVAQTGRTLWLASRTASADGLNRRIVYRPDGAAEAFTAQVQPGRPLQWGRVVAVGTDRPHTDLPDPLDDQELDDHVAAWEQKWQTGDFSFDGDDRTLAGLRWDLFSLHALGHFHSPDYSISATGLHGQGYFGHVFWDTDIFMLPFYLMTNPDTARDLLLYRYRRLDAARQVAAEHGYRGAKFPWTSTRDGLDVCPPDWERCGKRQIHISGDVAYAFDLYRHWTGDQAFFDRHGVEVLLETARFFRSRLAEGDDGQLHLLDVIGPDEYNIHADDNYYTNYLARWNLRRAVEALADLQSRDPHAHRQLADRLACTPAEADDLLEAAGRIAMPRTRNGVCEQYRGFFDLKDIGEIRRDENNMPLEKLHAYDQGYQIIKQADAVMMLFLFPDAFDEHTQRATFDYYEKRNSFGSSLSPSISCVTGLRLGAAEHAYGYFRLTALLDVEDLHIDKNAHEGIHAACAGGAAIAAFWGYGGVRVADGELRVEPTCPTQWQRLQMRLTYRGRPVSATATPDPRK